MTDIRERLEDGTIGPEITKLDSGEEPKANHWTIHIPKKLALYGSCFIGGFAAGWFAIHGIKTPAPIITPIEKAAEAAAEVAPDISTAMARVKGGNDVLDATAQQYHATQKAFAASVGVSEATVSRAIHETGRGVVAGHDVVRLHTSPELTAITNNI